MTTGDRIRQARLLRKLTQDELGRQIGVQKSAIAKYENGRVVNLKRETIHALAKALDVSPIWLMGMEDNPNITINVSLEENHVLEVYRAADPVYQKVAVDILEAHPADHEEEKEGYA